MKRGDLLTFLEAGADQEREERVAAAQRPPADWLGVESAPRDGSMLDVRFIVETAEPGMAEFYARGCTRGEAEPVIENVAFINGSFKPVIDGEGARLVASVKGGWGAERGTGYGIGGVTLSHWRPAAYPFID